MRKEVRRKFPVFILAVTTLILGVSPSFAEDLKKLATDLAARIHAAKHERVTVVDFVDLDKKPSKVGKYLAQQLQMALAEPENKLDVVDQSHLGQLIEQMEKLSEGLIDPATGRELGKVAGTEVLIVGTVMSSSMTVRLDVKAIDLQTAKLITGGSAKLTRIGIVDQLASDSGEEDETASAGREGSGNSGSANQGSFGKSAPRGPIRLRRDQGVDFEIDGCSVNGDSLTCAVTVTSDRDRWLAITLGSRAWNTAGEEFGPGSISIANSSSENDCAVRQVLKGVPTHASLTFQQFEADASIVERLRLGWQDANYCRYGGWRSVDFEKIALSEEDYSSPRVAARLTGGRERGQSGGEKGKGGFLDHLKNRALDILDETIEKKTRKLLGDDDPKPSKPPQP